MTVIKMIGVFALFVSVAVCQLPATLGVQGIGGTSATLSISDLSKLPEQTVKVMDHGTPTTLEGVLLSDVLSRVYGPTGETFKKTVASYYLIAEAHDGYKAVFTWAEIDPTFTDRRVYVVTKREGNPLTAKDGPYELIVPGEKRNSRWVRQLKLLRIEPLPTSTAYDSEAVRWIAASLTDMQGINVGMTRAEMLKVFMEEGGISNRHWRRYVYRNCGYIKVDVEFAAANNPDSHDESPEDRITKISQPFLEWSIRD